MSTLLLEARNITVGYAGEHGWQSVLEGFDVQLVPGEVVSVLGPSGVGKSSLLRVLAGLQTPYSGSVSLLGEAVTSPHPRVAVAFQDPSLLPWLNLESNVAFGLDFARQPKVAAAERKARVEQAIAEVGLQHATATTRRNCRAAWRSVLHWRAVWRVNRKYCYSTSRLAR